MKGYYFGLLGVCCHFDLRKHLWGNEVEMYCYSDESLEALFPFKRLTQMGILRCRIGIFKSHSNIHISLLLPWFL